MRILIAALCAILIVACSRGNPASPVTDAGAQGVSAARPLSLVTTERPLPVGAVRLQAGQIMDSTGFERPMVAQTGLIPAGWSTQGGYVWNASEPCAVADYNLSWTLLSPDGVTAVAFVPKPRWQLVQWNEPNQRIAGACENGRWTSVKEYLEFLAQQSPQARILDYQPRQDLIMQQEQQLRMMPKDNADSVQLQMHADAGQILVATTVNGHESREMIRATLLVTETRIMSVKNPGEVGSIVRDFAPISVVYARAPSGQLNVALPEAVEKSLRPTTEWADRVFNFRMKKQQAALDIMTGKGHFDQPALMLAQRRHLAQMASLVKDREARANLYDQSDLISNRTRRATIEAMRGVRVYHEPVDGGVILLDNNYDHAWRVQDGSYLLTDDPDFRPEAVGLAGQKLRRVE